MTYKDPWSDCRQVNICSRGRYSQQEIDTGWEGEQIWHVVDVPNYNFNEQFMYIEENDYHNIFKIKGGLCVAPPVLYVYKEPFLSGETLWHLYEAMSQQGLFRKREDQLGYYHYAGDGPFKVPTC